MSLEFLNVEPAAGTSFSPTARSAMEPMALSAGGRATVRDGWSVISGFTSAEAERSLCDHAVGFADCSYLAKLEVQGEPAELEALIREATGRGPEPGVAIRHERAWWCPVTATRLLVIAPTTDGPGLRRQLEAAVDRASGPASLTDVTSMFGAMTVVGPAARETFARFCALDLRPHVTPVNGLRPGSIARQPGILIREGEDRYLFLFGWAVGQYIWTVVGDAAEALSGGPVGADCLEQLNTSAVSASA